MYGMSMNAGDMLCPECKRVMVDLKGYDVIQDVATVKDDRVYQGRGGAGAAVAFFLFDAGDWIFQFFAERIRKARVRRLCRDVAPEFPASLICPTCLFLLKRKDKLQHPHDAMREGRLPFT